MNTDTKPNFDFEIVWEKVLSEVEKNVSKANFSTWFKDTYIAKEEDGVIYVAVQNAFVRDWLANRYHKFILKALRDLSPSVRGLSYIIAKPQDKEKFQKKDSIGIKKEATTSLPLVEHYTDRESNLNPRYTFDSFVVGPFNELAFSAAQAVLKNLGNTYNPLFIHGNTGHGKTHLIQAIGNEFKKNISGIKVYYLTSERFYLDFINAMQANRIPAFKERYRKYDILIMDDIQFLSTKERTQEELFHLFNTLYDGGKQIIFSSDKHPNFINGLEDRLKSRFSAGMIVDIPPPDMDSRLAIISKKVDKLGFRLSDETINLLAAQLTGNIREIEGLLNSLLCQYQMKGKELSLLEVKNMVKTHLKPKKATSVKDVVKAISAFYNIEENVVYEKSRRKEVVKPRQIAMYILREDCNVSFPLIGEKLGGRDHTTVIHSYEKIKEGLKNDPDLIQELEQIRSML